MAWRDFWPFGRRAKPQPVDCRANGNWVPGDLALCTENCWFGPPLASDPLEGKIYRVVGVSEGVVDNREFDGGVLLNAFWLEFEELPGAIYTSNTFRKVVPDHSACEDEFREFLLGGPTVPALTPETAA